MHQIRYETVQKVRLTKWRCRSHRWRCRRSSYCSCWGRRCLCTPGWTPRTTYTGWNSSGWRTERRVEALQRNTHILWLSTPCIHLQYELSNFFLSLEKFIFLITLVCSENLCISANSSVLISGLNQNHLHKIYTQYIYINIYICFNRTYTWHQTCTCGL